MVKFRIFHYNEIESTVLWQEVFRENKRKKNTGEIREYSRISHA